MGLVRDVIGSVPGRTVGRVDICKSERGEVLLSSSVTSCSTCSML